MSRLYTYLPKDNTALTEGLLSTALSDKGFEKYRGRTGKHTKEDVLKVLDSWEPDWTRSKAISALTEPIPEDAAEDFLEFARNRRLYSFDTKDLIKARILAHLRRARKGGGTDPVYEVKKERLNWHRKKKHLLFQGVPHYFVETTGGKIPPEFVREEKKASAKIDIPALYDEVRRSYADMGYPVSGDRLVLSEQPTYVDGRPVPKDVINPRSSGGNTQDDGTVRINPRYRAVMRHWKIKGSGRDFLRKIIGHELGHHIDKSVLSKSERAEERKRLLREIVKAKFHTVYTDSYGPDTDPRKLDKELLAEYLADIVRRKLEKKAQAFSQDGKTVTLSKGQTPSHVVAAYNKAHPNSKITVPQFLQANGNLAATKFRAGKAYNMPTTTPAAAVPTKTVAAPVRPAASAAPVKPVVAPVVGPIGFRQHNPGNLRSDGKTLWQGASGVPAAGKFLTFKDPYSGVRAMSRVIRNYGKLHKIDTLRGVVNRYAPAVENNQKAYMSAVSKSTGFKPDDKINLTNEATLQKLVPAMGAYEIGPRYFSTYNPSLVSNAVSRAVSGR